MSQARGGWSLVYIGVVVLVGGAAIVHSLVDLLRPPVDWRWLVIAALTLFSGATTLRMSSVPVSFSIAETFTFAALLMAGPAAGTITVALDCLSVSIRLARGGLAPRRFAFNLTAPPLAMWVAGRVLFALADTTALSSAPEHFGPLLAALGLTAATYYFLNTFLIALAIALEERRPVLRIWRDHFLPLWLTFVGGAYAAALLVVFLRELNIRFLVLMAPLPLLLYVALRAWLARVDDRVCHLEQLNLQAQALNEQATLRQQAELALRERDKLFHAVFDNAVDALVVLDDERRFLDVNPAAHRLLGTIGRDRFPERLDAVLDPLSAESIDERWAAFLSAGEARGEIRLIGGDPKGLVVEYTQKAQVLPGRHLAVWRDVSERKQLEEQLRQSQKMETVGRLAGGVAHDFNNILTAIMGYAALTLDRVDGEVREDVQEIVHAAERAAALTRQLLAFSRKQVLESVVVHLDDVVGGVEKMLHRLVGEDVELKTARHRGLWNVRVDRGQFEQVIVNLVVNARDAMPDGGVVTVSLMEKTVNAPLPAWSVEELPPGQYVQFIVSDSGMGMTEEVRRQVFEPFFTTKAVGQGTGLGLATVYGIVQQSGGYISVESAPGCGATFTISLPAVTGAVTAGVPPADLGSAAFGSETILLAEDEPAVRALTRSALIRQGYRVIEAATGVEACELLENRSEPIDLVLTDVVMPGMSGPELVRRLRVRYPELKAIYMSGYHDDALLRHSVRGKETTFLPKPFLLKDLIQIVHDVLTNEAPVSRRGDANQEVRPQLPARRATTVDPANVLRTE